MTRKTLWLALFAFVFAAFFPSSIFASDTQRVKFIHPDGSLELEDGRFVTFAGIQISREAVWLLPVLMPEKTVELEFDSDLAKAAAPKLPAYVYTHTRRIGFPANPKESPEEKRGHVNEYLVESGAASVDEQAEFKYKKKFLELQEEARKKGEGIWSYEFKPKKGKTP